MMYSTAHVATDFHAITVDVYGFRSDFFYHIAVASQEPQHG